jgi:hypothetical protein
MDLVGYESEGAGWPVGIESGHQLYSLFPVTSRSMSTLTHAIYPKSVTASYQQPC